MVATRSLQKFREEREKERKPSTVAYHRDEREGGDTANKSFAKPDSRLQKNGKVQRRANARSGWERGGSMRPSV